VLVTLTLIFGLVANEMKSGETRAFDNAILLAMRNDANHADPIGPKWFEDAVRDVTSLGGNTVLTIIVLGTVGFLWLSRAHGARPGWSTARLADVDLPRRASSPPSMEACVPGARR
jgi:hypothetical protein